MKKNNKIDFIRHSLSHLLALAVLKKFPETKLGIGPVIENGFYYDFLLPQPINQNDLADLEKEIKNLIKENLFFKGEKITPHKALKLFQNQPFKIELIKELIKNKKQITIYKTYKKNKDKEEILFIDLCKGGHIKNTKEINLKAFKLTQLAGAYWQGDEKNPMLTRIYGVAFSTEKELNDYLTLLKEIEKRDHRKLGEQLNLFSFENIAPGAVFWHHNGLIIFKELEKMIREELEKFNYQEISTPIMVKKEIFETSGHWQYYKENMFYFEKENETFVLKPMNCPESTFIYNSKIRSYKDLPLRLAEMGRIFRNELSGTLGGLLRVRQITQDDAHIYCRPDQIQEEISSLIKLILKIYKLFNFESQFYLSTKPDDALGDKKLWQKAEKALKLALKNNNIKYQLKPKDGAFYGPKIDIEIKDALKRSWQLATIQLDLVMLPEKFNLYYIDEKGKKQKPVVIHRAIFGSFERFIGVLLEHTAGELPLWLSPLQAKIIPVSQKHLNYALKIFKILKEKNIRVEIDKENETVSKKIRNNEILKIPYLIIVGDKEIKNKTINLRERKNKEIKEVKIEDFLKKIEQQIKQRKY